MNKIDQAIVYITQVFAGQTRKASNTPAVLHSLEAGTIVASMTDNEDVIVGALLHDVIEDAGIQAESIREMYNQRVMELVLSETENKYRNLPSKDTWQRRKEEAIALLENTNDIDIKMLYLADKLSNMRSMYNGINEQGDKFWDNFHQNDPSRHCWYYRSIANLTKELSNYLAWQEYDSLIQVVFKENQEEK